MKTFKELEPLYKEKRVLYITTKNLDYIRVTQQINTLRKSAEQIMIIGSKSVSYPKRLLYVYRRLMGVNMAEFDLVFVGFSPQLILPFFANKLSRKIKIFDCFISVYDTMVSDRQKFKPGSLMARFCHNLDEKTLAKADYIICDTKAHGGFFSEEFNCPIEKMYVEYLEADSNIYSPMPMTREPDQKHHILYFGSILNLQGVDVILDALREFDGDNDFEFEIIGPIHDSMNKPIQENIHYIPWLSQHELAEHIANADLCLAGHFSGDIMKAKRTIPGKAYIYEAMGRPMILGDGPANHELFIKDDKHIFVPMGNALALAQAIINYFE